MMGIPGQNGEVDRDIHAITDDRYQVPQVDDMFPNAYVERKDPLSDIDTVFEASDLWWKIRLENRYYPVAYRSRNDYLRAKEEKLPKVARIKHRISDIEDKDTLSEEERLAEYMSILSEDVYPNFGRVMIEDIFSDNFDSRSSGPHVHYMNELLIPTLQSLENSFIDTSVESKREVMSSLLNFVKEKCNTDHAFLDTHRYEFVVSMLKIGGIEALPYVRGIFDDLFEKIGYSEKRFISIMQQELGLSNDVDIVWAYNPRTGELGYFPKESLAEGIVPLGPQSDEEFLTSVALESSNHEHLLLHRDTVRLLGRYGQENESDTAVVLSFLAEFMKYNSHGVLADYVSVFQDLGIERSIPYLLNNLQDEDILRRRMSAEILYRVELGRLGVTSEGASILGKLYDLGKLNDPDFFVRRLDTTGLMAILKPDEEGLGGSIEGVFPLKLESGEKVVQAQVRQLITQDLFLPKVDETPDQRKLREDYLQVFVESYESIFNYDFFNGTGVRLNSLNLHEQGWFLLTFLKRSSSDNPQDLQELKDFVKCYGEFGLKAFLALEYGGSGQDIINFASNSGISREDKMSIFRDYYATTAEAYSWREIFSEAVVTVGETFPAEVHEAIIRKSSEFFKAAQIITTKEDVSENMHQLQESMRAFINTLRLLKDIRDRDGRLVLDPDKGENPVVTREYLSPGKNSEDIVEEGRFNWFFVDKVTGAKVKILIRPEDTYRSNGDVTGARINFQVEHRDNTFVRIAFDNSRYQMLTSGAERPYISMDLNIRRPESGDAITDILSVVPNSEGTHNESSFSAQTQENFAGISREFNAYLLQQFV